MEKQKAMEKLVQARNIWVSNKKVRYASVAVAVFLVILCIVGMSGLYVENQYDKAVSAVLEDNYTVATEVLASNVDYKDAEHLLSYLALKRNFDESNQASYAVILSTLNTLSFTQTPMIQEQVNTFYEQVFELEEVYQMDCASADKIVQTIAKIPVSLTLQDENQIKQARQLYDEATSNVQQLVTNTDALQQSETDMVDLIVYHAECKVQAEKTDKVILALKEVTISSESAVKKARTSYDALDEVAQGYVTSYAKLQKAEKQYDDLLKAEAAKVDDMIAEIQDVTLTSGDQIQQARTRYDDLDKTMQGYVSGYTVLQEAENDYQILVKQEEERKEKEEEDAARKQLEAQESVGATVYWTPNGEKYHSSENCATLKRSKTIYSGSINSSGRTPCKVCH